MVHRLVGSTETSPPSPAALEARAPAASGLPLPGMELKFIPTAKLGYACAASQSSPATAMRQRSPRRPSSREGYYRIGDAGFPGRQTGRSAAWPSNGRVAGPKALVGHLGVGGHAAAQGGVGACADAGTWWSPATTAAGRRSSFPAPPAASRPPTWPARAPRCWRCAARRRLTRTPVRALFGWPGRRMPMPARSPTGLHQPGRRAASPRGRWTLCARRARRAVIIPELEDSHGLASFNRSPTPGSSTACTCAVDYCGASRRTNPIDSASRSRECSRANASPTDVVGARQQHGIDGFSQFTMPRHRPVWRACEVSAIMVQRICGTGFGCSIGRRQIATNAASFTGGRHQVVIATAGRASPGHQARRRLVGRYMWGADEPAGDLDDQTAENLARSTASCANAVFN